VSPAASLSCCRLHAWSTGILLLLPLAYDQVLAILPQLLVWLQVAAESIFSQHTAQHLRQQQSARAATVSTSSNSQHKQQQPAQAQA
jgi:hypothetical protein